MKTLILFFLLSLFLGSCGGSDDKQQVQLNDTSIVGTWQLVEAYSDSGDGNGQWILVEEGYTYIFETDSTFETTKSSSCFLGKYRVLNDSLYLSFSKTEHCQGFERIEIITFNIKGVTGEGLLSFYPTYLTCDEGCGYRFKKIAE